MNTLFPSLNPNNARQSPVAAITSFMNPNFDAAQQALSKGLFCCLLPSLVTAGFLTLFVLPAAHEDDSAFWKQVWPSNVATRDACCNALPV